MSKVYELLLDSGFRHNRLAGVNNRHTINPNYLYWYRIVDGRIRKFKGEKQEWTVYIPDKRKQVKLLWLLGLI
jgi:hypothetical protein